MSDPPPDLATLAEHALRRSARAASAGKAAEAARWLKLHRDYGALLTADAQADRRTRNQACDDARHAAEALAAVARAHLKGADVQGVVDRLADAFDAPKLDALDAPDADSIPLTRLNRERLTKARDKALRRGLTTRAAELQTRLDQAALP